MNERIAQRLAELRRAKGYSQEALARELGLSRQAVSKWERVESSPEMENLIALARLYGVSLDDLLRLEDDARDDVEDEHTGCVREQEAETSWQIEKTVRRPRRRLLLWKCARRTVKRRRGQRKRLPGQATRLPMLHERMHR